MFYKMKEFIKEIGKYSFDAMLQSHQIDFKEDNQAILSIVTDVDLHNSQAFKEFTQKTFLI